MCVVYFDFSKLYHNLLQSSYHQTGEIWARKMDDKVSGKFAVILGSAGCDQ